MTDLSEYVTKGDLSAPFVRTREVERAQEQAQSMHHHVQAAVAKAPPLSAEQRDQLAQLLRPDLNQQKPAMMRWRLRRYCGDVVEEVAHAKHLGADDAFRLLDRCPACGREPSIVVDAEPLGIVAPD